MTTTLVVFSLAGTMFFWAVALISPPAANRAPAGPHLPRRQWLILGVGAVVWSLKESTADRQFPVYIWTMYSTILLCIQLFINVNERDRWGPRVTRHIPRFPLLRLPVFLFSSGAAGGVTLSVLLLLGTFLLARVVVVGLPGQMRATTTVPVAKFTAALALYTYCYCLSAGAGADALARRPPAPAAHLAGGAAAGGAGQCHPLPDRVYLFLGAVSPQKQRGMVVAPQPVRGHLRSHADLLVARFRPALLRLSRHLGGAGDAAGRALVRPTGAAFRSAGALPASGRRARTGADGGAGRGTAHPGGRAGQRERAGSPKPDNPSIRTGHGRGEEG